MATQNFMAAANISTDAYFRAWGKALSDAIQSVGFLKTADTGQIDWTSVLHPTSSGQVMGYEIRASTDDLSSTFKYYVKIEYGAVGNTISNACLYITVGTGTDGAGNLTGVTTKRFAIGNYSSSSTSYPCYVSGDSGRLSFVLFMTTDGNFGLCFTIDRFKDDSGNSTDEGVDIVAWSSYSGTYYDVASQQSLLKGGFINPGSPCKVTSAMPSGSTGSFGNNIGLYPIQPNIGYPGNTTLNGLVYFKSDIPTPGGTVDLMLYGVVHTFLLAGCTSYATNLNGASGTAYLAVRYE